MKAKNAFVIVSMVVVVFFSVRLIEAQAVGKSTCDPVPIRVTIYENVVDPVTGARFPSTITSDGAEYVDGAPGVSAILHICGTKDATLNLSGKRTIKFNLTSPIPGSVIEEQPAWVPALVSSTGFINVRNLVYSHQPFTTHMGTDFSLQSAGTYQLRFMPYAVDAPDLHTDPSVLPSENTPYDSSPATVYPQPYDCNSGGTTKPSWIVIGNNVTPRGFLQVGTLHKLLKSTTRVHEGQYQMPFELRIEALTCFDY
jgi:hypothetical protein